MNVLLVVPSQAPVRGNMVTALRWQNGLARAGIDVTIVTPAGLAGRPAPDLVHAHHAARSGPAAAAFARDASVPLLVSLGGTDLNGGPGGDPLPATLDTLGRARAVVAPCSECLERLRGFAPGAPPGFSVRRGIAPLPCLPPRPPDGRLVLVAVGGIRRGKGQFRAAGWVERLRRTGLPATLRLVGPVLEPAYAREIRERYAGADWLDWTGTVPHDRMAEVYAGADAVLNASESEGASNAILEALVHGRPVAARGVPGNRHLLVGLPAGSALCFNDDRLDRLERWLADLHAAGPKGRSHAAERARTAVLSRHHVDDEIRELVAAYASVVGRAPAGWATPFPAASGQRGEDALFQ